MVNRPSNAQLAAVGIELIVFAMLSYFGVKWLAKVLDPTSKQKEIAKIQVFFFFLSCIICANLYFYLTYHVHLHLHFQMFILNAFLTLLDLLCFFFILYLICVSFIYINRLKRLSSSQVSIICQRQESSFLAFDFYCIFLEIISDLLIKEKYLSKSS